MTTRFSFFLLLATALLAGCSKHSADEVRLLNISYDPTRELWQEVNKRFVDQYNKDQPTRVAVNQSHGGSSSQARAVIDGLEADVVTLALWSDTDAIRKAGLIDEGWEERFPNKSLPYLSTIVFVVRKGNPKQIKDWQDLVRDDVSIITPSPKTSGNGKLSFLAAWGSVVLRGGSDEDATRYVTELYRRVPVLDSAARGATTTFAQKGIGDVHLTWENEANLEVKEAKGALEILYPPLSIRAEPKVAIVDANARRRGTEAAAKAYLEFLYTHEGQELIAKHYYRPFNEEVLAANQSTFPHIELFSIEKIVPGWDEANEKFFTTGALFDRIYEGTSK